MSRSVFRSVRGSPFNDRIDRIFGLGARIAERLTSDLRLYAVMRWRSQSGRLGEGVVGAVVNSLILAHNMRQGKAEQKTGYGCEVGDGPKRMTALAHVLQLANACGGSDALQHWALQSSFNAY